MSCTGLDDATGLRAELDDLGPVWLLCVGRRLSSLLPTLQVSSMGMSAPAQTWSLESSSWAAVVCH